MSRRGVVQGRFTADQQNMLTFKASPWESLRRVRIGKAWFFCRPSDFFSEGADNRRRLRQLSKAQPDVRAGWVATHGRRELAWLIGPEDHLLVPEDIMKHALLGGVVGALGLAAFIGAFWLMLFLFGSNGPMADMPGWWSVPFLLVFCVGTVGGCLAMFLGFALVPRGLSAPRRWAYRAFHRQTQAVDAQAFVELPSAPASLPEPRLDIDPISGLAVLEGRIRHVGSTSHETQHRTLAAPGYAMPIESDHLSISIEGSDTVVRLRTLTQDALFVYPGDAVRVVGIAQDGAVELLGMRNLTDGSGYVVRPASSMRWWGAHLLGGLILLAGGWVLGMQAWDGTLTVDAARQVLGTSGAVLAGLYGLVFVGYRLGLRNRSVQAHAQPGDRSDIRRTRVLLDLPPRGGAVVL